MKVAFDIQKNKLITTQRTDIRKYYTHSDTLYLFLHVEEVLR